MRNKQLIAFYTLFRKEFGRVLRIWPQTLVPPVITMSLYFMIFGKLVGSRVGSMQGLDYINFITPGLIMMAIINNSYINVCSSFYSSKFQRSLEELLIAPVSYHIIILGYCSGGIARAIICAILIFFISSVFTDIEVHSIWITIFLAFMTSSLFSLAGIINGMLAVKFDDVSIVPMFILTPLTYLGGVFYSVDLLPGMWFKLTMLNPIFYIVNGFRAALLGISDISMHYSLIMLTFFIAFFYLVTYRLFVKGTGIRN